MVMGETNSQEVMSLNPGTDASFSYLFVIKLNCL